LRSFFIERASVIIISAVLPSISGRSYHVSFSIFGDLECTSFKVLLIPHIFDLSIASPFTFTPTLNGSTVSVLAPSNAAIYKSIVLNASFIYL